MMATLDAFVAYQTLWALGGCGVRGGSAPRYEDS